MTWRLQDFAGLWQVSRQITDRQAGQTGVFEGQARFEPAAQGLAYLETGFLTLTGHPAFKAERRYHWSQEGAEIAVAFADGAPFHRFVPQPEAVGTDHLCGQDLYAVRYTLADWPDWQVIYQVSGPRKDYTSVTHYVRV